MPIARMQAPDGRIARFEVPEGTTPEQAQTMFDSWYSSQAQPVSNADKLPVSGGRLGSVNAQNPVTASLLRGMTLGASDYVGAAGEALGGSLANLAQGKPFDIGGEYERARLSGEIDKQQFEKERPVTSAVSGLVGGLAMPMPGGAAKSLGGRVLEGAGIGAGAGAISGGLNTYGGPSEKAEGALAGGVLGGLLGGGVPLAGRLVGAVASPFANRMKSPQDVATGRLGDLVSQTGKTPDELAAQYKKLGPAAQFMDVNPLMTAEAERIVTSGGKPGLDIEAGLRERALGRGERLGQAVNRGLKPDEFSDMETKVVQTLSKNADEAYTAVRKNIPYIWSQDLRDMLSRPTIREALGTAMKNAADEGRPFGIIRKDGKFARAEDFDTGDGIQAFSFDALQDVKRTLDDIINSESNQLTGKLTNRGRIVNNLKKDLIEAAEKSDPKGLWRAAREQYAGDADVINALRAGRDILKDEPYQIAKGMKDMSFSEKDAFRTGAAQSIMNAIKSTPDTGDAARRITGNQLLRERLRPMFDKEREYREFISQFGREGQLLSTERRIAQGSPTARRMALQKNGMDERLVDVAASARQGMIPFLGSTYTHARDWASGISPDVNASLAQMLMSRDPRQIAKMTQAFKDAPGLVDAMKRRQAGLSNRGIAATSQLMGQAVAPDNSLAELLSRR